MNERIKELIAKASSWVEVDCDYGTDSEYQLDAKKFAELIINECCVTADANADDTDDTKYPSYWIKKHFGVEE